MNESGEDAPYGSLTPDTVLSAVEALDLACDGRLLALNSYENRVYRVGLEDRPALIVKFYRPGRWSDEAILEEHSFSHELVEAGLAVSAPLELRGHSLHRHAGFRYALFTGVGGRAPEPDRRESLLQLGRSLGRLHMVGASGRFRHRPTLSVAGHGQASVDTLLSGGWLPGHLAEPFQVLSGHLLDAMAASWRTRQPMTTLRLHGDCHIGNLLEHDGRIVFVDLDDAMTGPAIQDLWLLVSGDEDDARRQWNWLLEGYTALQPFDVRELALVETLRGLRLLHYNAWLARRWHDPAFPAAFPWFADERHWQALIGQMHEQLAAIQQPPIQL